MSEMNWTYDKSSGRYIVRNARIEYTNFAGEANDMNTAGRRNFKLRLDEDLYNALVQEGVTCSMKPPMREGQDTKYTVKANVYPNSKIFLLGGNFSDKPIPFEELKIVDDEISGGYVMNGEISVVFHVSLNTMLSRPAYYIRVDEMNIPVRESYLAGEREQYARSRNAEVLGE